MTRSNIILILLVACLALLPLTESSYALRLGTTACMYCVMALSWNVIGGYTGYPSFATAAFFGLGAYAGGILLGNGMPLWFSVPAAGVISFTLAGMLGAVLLRLKGHYFAIASLALVEVLREVVNHMTDLTGGGMGLNIPVTSGSSVLAEAQYFYYVMWAVLVVTTITVILVSMSRLGFGMSCIRQNEAASQMVGLNTTLYKSIAFGISAAIVGAAGSVYAAWVHYIDPTDVFDVLYSVKPIVMALIGGLGSALGVLIGALVYLGLEEVVWRNYIQIHSGVLGVLIIILLLFLPRGLTSLRGDWLMRRLRRV